MTRSQQAIYRTDHVELMAMVCRKEFGLGFLLSVLDGNHLSISLLLGCFDFSVDVWIPAAEVPA